MLSRLSLPLAFAAIVFSAHSISPGTAAAAHRPASSYTYTLVTEPGQGLTPIYNFIGTAKKTIDMTMYEFTDTEGEQLLAQAAAAGVTVRVILDQNLEKSNNQAAYTYLTQNGVQVHWANPTYSATHQKTITVDGATSAIMTLNLTSQYYSTSRDFAVIENDPNDVAAIEQTFNADFTNTAVTPPDGDDLVWSPTNSQSAMLALINSAQHSLLVENEEMSDTNIVNALVSAASRGVLVQIAMTNDANEYSSEFNQLVAAGAEIGTYAETASLYIHAKVILADYGSPDASVFIGSENFSSASLTKNRELGLIISDPTIMASIYSTLTSDFTGGTPWTGSKGNFSTEASPDALTVAAGSSGTTTVTTKVFDGFSAAVSLSASGLPSGVTAGFSPSSIAAPGSGSSTLKLTVGSGAAAGTYSFTVTGSGGGVTSTAGVSLTITSSGNPSFSLLANPTALTVAAGGSGQSTVTASISGGFNAAISLSASGLPSGVTAGFNPTSIAAPGSGSSILTLSAAASAVAGAYTVTITGTGGGLTETTSVSLTITAAPSFSLTANPTSVTVADGGTGKSTITASISGGFDNAISLSASGLPAGVTAAFSPASIAAPGSGSSTLTFTAGSGAAAGVYSITITGAGGGLTETTTVSLTVTSSGSPSFSLSASPASLTVAPGASANSTITASISGGFNAAISLAASGLPAGVTAAFVPAQIAAPGSGTSTLTLTASSSATAGTYSITVTGTGGGLTANTSVSLTVSSSSGTQLVTDGGFESATGSGLTAPGWSATTNISGRKVIVYHGSYPYSGHNYASMGGSNSENDTLTQTITVPAGATAAQLTFWVSISTTETNGKAYDYLYVEIHNTAGTLLATPVTLNNTNSTSDGNTEGDYFQPQAVNLSAYAGQTIELVFHATTDYEKPTTFLVDNVSVEAN